MKCRLCAKEIKNFNADFNLLIIDETRKHNVCNGCVEKFTNWQGKVLSKLFPTKALKKRYEEK